MTTPVYFQIDGAPGDYFACKPLRATLSTAACAQRYERDNGPHQSGTASSCRGCAIGALHAGGKAPSPLYGSLICPRCERGAARLVRGLCVSCVNRQYEFVRGRNARGGAAPRLELAPLGVLVMDDDGSMVCAHTELAASYVEVIWRTLRTRPNARYFHPRLPQAIRMLRGDLFEPPKVKV